VKDEAKGSVHAQNEYVGSEKGDPKPKIEIGSQTGGENEETESRDQKSGSRGGAALYRDLVSVITRRRSSYWTTAQSASPRHSIVI